MSTFAGIEHVAIAARDSSKLTAWYVEHLGFSVSASVDNGPGKSATFYVQLGETYVEIMPSVRDIEPASREIPDRGFSHLAISVGDFDRAVSLLNAARIPKEGGERSGPWGSRIQFYRDPEGNLFHLLWRPAPLPKN